MKFKTKIKSNAAAIKAKAQAKYMQRLKDISEMQNIIIEIESIRIALALEVTVYTKALELAGCKLKLSANKGQAYRNMVKFDRVFFNLAKLKQILACAYKVQKYHEQEKKNK